MALGWDSRRNVVCHAISRESGTASDGSTSLPQKSQIGYDPAPFSRENHIFQGDKFVPLCGLLQGAFVVSSLFQLALLPALGACGSGALRYSIVPLFAVLAGAGCAHQQSTVTARSETAERLSAEARQAKVRGDEQSAEHLLAEAVERNPSDCETRLELSEMLLAHGSSEAAASHLQKLVDQNPDDPRSYVGLAEAMYMQRNLAEADRLVAKALELDPHQTRSLLLRGKIEQARGADKQALEDYYQLYACEPDHIEVTMLIAGLHLRHGDASLAAPLLRSIVENPEQETRLRASAQWMLGRCYAHDGRWSDAAQALAGGISSRRGTSDDWLELANACWRSGETQQARSAVDQALRRAPDNPQAQALLAALDDDTRAAQLPDESRVSRTDYSDDEND
jgi:Flp pilus assembly protein TadD